MTNSEIYFLIFVFDMGVAGAAISTFVARVYISLFVILMLRRDRQPIVLKNYHAIRPDWSLIGRFLMVGVPAGIENGMFQFGKSRSSPPSLHWGRPPSQPRP